MGSKKHKKESKKKKHRSRSRSPLEGEERERKRHRKHKDRKKDRSPDVEEVPVDSHLVQDNGREGSAASAERERDRDTERDREKDRDRDSERDRERDRDRDSERDRERDSDRYAERDRERERDRDSERDRERDSDRYAERDRERERDRDSERDRERDRDREKRSRAHAERDEHSGYRYERERSESLELSRSASPVAGGSGAGASGSGGGPQESLSVEQANRLRAKLGLKPLSMAEKPADDGKLKDDLGEFYHKPATNIAAQRKSDKIRERLEERKEKRKYEHKLQTTLLAEEDGDEDASAWVQKSREIDKQKQEAAKRAAMLDELDAEFGVTALVADEQRADAERSYTARELRGLRVAHEMDALADERETVLTLADKEVLAEDAEDVLVNVNIVDDERYKKNQLERKKARAGYQAYDDEAELEAALGFQRPVLAKYDDEIDNGQAAAKQRGFVIGDESAAHAQRFREARRQELVQGGVDKRLESLRLPAPRLATEYLDHHEIQAKFKKPKRKGKMRKKAKEEPIDVDDYEAGGATLDTDDTDVRPDQLCAPLAVDDEEVEPDSELQTALARARRLRQAERLEPPPPPAFKMEESMETTDDGADEEHEGGVTSGGAMVLDATAEFCRTLGDIPTYGQAGNRDHHAEIMDYEREQLEAETDAYMDGREAAAAAGAGGGAAGAGGGAAGAAGAGGAPGEAGAGGAWSRVDVRSDKQPDLAAGSTVGLDAEPLLGAGVSGALQLALSKGYLERAGTAPAPRPLAQHHLAARHYSIEDKSAGGEDDKYGRRERGHHHHGHGPVQDFREKAHFRPNIKLEYVDDDGRPLCPKEAFRYLSHKFHGKGPGKNKQEKRIKKAVQEGLMKKMSSTDTPLGTLQMLQDKQRETRSPYIVLSGAKRENNA